MFKQEQLDQLSLAVGVLSLGHAWGIQVPLFWAMVWYSDFISCRWAQFYSQPIDYSGLRSFAWAADLGPSLGLLFAQATTGCSLLQFYYAISSISQN